MAKKQRWRNYALWVSITSQVILLAQLLGNLTGLFVITEEVSAEVLTVVNTILGLLVVLGIVSNPTKPDGQGFNL